MSDGHDWRHFERRKEDPRGWTWWKEIVGTIIGVITVISVPAGFIWNWARSVEDRVNARIVAAEIQAGQISTLKDLRVEQVDQLKVLNAKVDQMLRDGVPARR